MDVDRTERRPDPLAGLTPEARALIWASRTGLTVLRNQVARLEAEAARALVPGPWLGWRAA